MERDIVYGKWGVVSYVGKSIVDTTSYDIPLVGHSVVVGAKQDYSTIVATVSRVIFITAREP